MKKITILLSGFITCLSFSARAQVKPQQITSDIAFSRAKIKSVRANNGPSGKTVTNEAFTKLLDSLLYNLSGTAVKNGKAVSTAVIVDDKSATLNYTFLDLPAWTIQATGSAQSKNSFADIFSGGKFGNTYSYGFNILYYPAVNSGRPFRASKNDVTIKTEKVMNDYEKATKLLAGRDIDRLIELYKKYGRYFLGNAPIDSPLTVDAAEIYYKEKDEFDKLIKKYAAYLPKSFSSMTAGLQDKHFEENIVAEASQVYLHRLYKEEVDSLNAIQMKAGFSHMTLSYLTFGVRYNNGRFPIFDGTASDDLYTRKYTDNYPSLSAGYNLIKLRPEFNIFILPTAKIQYNREFNDDDLVFLDIPQGQQIIGGTSSVEYKQTSYYRTIPDKKTHVNIDVPFSVFFPRSPILFGFEIAAKTDVAPELKNLGGRIGVYLVLSAGKQNLTIEPLINLNKLEQKDKSFFSDQVSFGVNLSVTLPELAWQK
ncbi:hypothetical protein INP83_10905 [Mucilaginibacter sp. 21P]|uniref:hypothetical protein n=1 Tax=Mucilaginibacter sp. 21P TaxID=2778902 RepID=UPI001C57870A|nr:hypothetical protein [Mucilaginibacter sp. 21P]QXV63626.1 hypothetical protein INP83_10905 [Mucilaginibacter sp. 21P]